MKAPAGYAETEWNLAVDSVSEARAMEIVGTTSSRLELLGVLIRLRAIAERTHDVKGVMDLDRIIVQVTAFGFQITQGRKEQQ